MLLLDHKATLKSKNHVFSPIVSKCYSHLSKIQKLFNKIVHEVARIMRRTCLHLPVESTSGHVITTLGKVIIERKREKGGSSVGT